MLKYLIVRTYVVTHTHHIWVHRKPGNHGNQGKLFFLEKSQGKPQSFIEF